MTSQPASPESAEVENDALRLALLTDLELSLRASERAILSRDVAGLERATDEQANLGRRLVLLPVRGGAFSPTVMEAQRRVLGLGRVQGALLERAQRRLRVLANWMAGPQAEYRPVSGDSAGVIEIRSQK